eukprot:tig00000194_g14756.t1
MLKIGLNAVAAAAGGAEVLERLWGEARRRTDPPECTCRTTAPPSPCPVRRATPLPAKPLPLPAEPLPAPPPAEPRRRLPSLRPVRRAAPPPADPPPRAACPAAARRAAASAR